MDFITKMFVKAQNWHKGQTMTEYALILSAVAVVVYAGYQTMGTKITALLTSVEAAFCSSAYGTTKACKGATVATSSFICCKS